MLEDFRFRLEGQCLLRFRIIPVVTGPCSEQKSPGLPKQSPLEGSRCVSVVWIAAGINPITQQKWYLHAYFQHDHVMKCLGTSRNFFYRKLFFWVSRVISPKALTSCCCVIDTNHELIVIVLSYVFYKGKITCCQLKSYVPVGVSPYSCFALWRSFAY